MMLVDIILLYSIFSYSHAVQSSKSTPPPFARSVSVATKTSFWHLPTGSCELLCLTCSVWCLLPVNLHSVIDAWTALLPLLPLLLRLLTVWSCDPCPQLPIGCTAVLSFRCVQRRAQRQRDRAFSVREAYPMDTPMDTV